VTTDNDLRDALEAIANADAPVPDSHGWTAGHAYEWARQRARAALAAQSEPTEAGIAPTYLELRSFAKWVAANAMADDPVWVARDVLRDYTFADLPVAPDWFKYNAVIREGATP